MPNFMFIVANGEVAQPFAPMAVLSLDKALGASTTHRPCSSLECRFRFVLADTEKLHRKIAQMSDRIRQLEDGLAVLQSTLTHDPHPLLHRDLLKIKSSIELHSAVDDENGTGEQETIEDSQYIDAFGTLAIRDDGAATFYGRSAGSEVSG
jgi:hypothetical protein